MRPELFPITIVNTLSWIHWTKIWSHLPKIQYIYYTRKIRRV